MLDSFPRHLALTGACNFRDLGGYPGKDGRSVRWRQLFRSNHLAHLSGEDIAVVRGLGLRSAFDLRGVEERLSTMCCVDDITVHSLPIEPAIMIALRDRLMAGKPLSAAETAELMRESYRDFVQNNTKAFRALFGHLLEDHAPLVIHCTAGKDRTGFACALILHALGVAEATIVEDYLLTNRHYRLDDATARTLPLPPDITAVLVSVEDSFLAAAFEAIRTEYGGLDAYFADGLGLSPQACCELEARYLER
ncbi:protein-tyrosine phosphatase [Rhodopseudomonas rhenobacensis]|uniref:Protein-tyrosine phosphatase n=1 Tax=Rhodopseudomonas rhenobacensis TaxID=87461 RepID=A0A7W8DY41_9BRAD|nr:tyrosine-protein phosphatase [Rhodopseudomonas rhenobacensis]MBB5046412.1 protein-tyrosine phosphatase [Rhodopseudomonas rhenobacensis]